jgi:hypothetical protein
MAAAGLTQAASRQARGRWLPAGLPGAWLRAYTAIWVGMLAFAAIVALTGPTLAILVHERARLALSPQLTPPPSAGHVLVLLALNLPVAAWPLLLGVIDVHRHRLSRWLADALLLVCFTRNVLWVGAALGTYGARLLPYVPQLPLEWAGLALGASAWLVQRRRPLSVPLHERLVWLGLTAGVLLLAAVLETVAVPHQ